MFSKRKKSVPAGDVATNFLLTYFIVGLVILSLAFVYYTKQILQLNRDLDEQISPLANLAAEIPGVKEKRLQTQLTQIIRQSLAVGWLSFIITDAESGHVVIARGIDESIERKLNAEPPIPLSPTEESKLRGILERMKRKAKEREPRRIKYSFKGRMLYAYFYYGEAASTAIDQIPFVITDTEDKPQKWQIWGEMVTAENATPEEYEQASRVVDQAKAFGNYVPLQTTPELQPGNFHYEKTPYYGLIVMPAVLLLVFSTFLIVGFLSYKRIKSCEQAAIWGGLAKETAHQLGTPISSLMAWVEFLTDRNRGKVDETATEIYTNMQQDLARLQKVTSRFGTIGSYPPKTETDINLVINDVVSYFQKRLPNRNKHVEIRVTPRSLPVVWVNPDLLQWVFENLIRNSLDAMDKEFGLIEIHPDFNEKKQQIVIQYRDNGSGIKRKDRYKIFQPGMTTKKHGWGVGLTVAQRIVEAYHHGQIRLVETGPDGTGFELVLPLSDGEETEPHNLKVQPTTGNV
jgi:nitrogen-specific signal transduction histidine kinase